MNEINLIFANKLQELRKDSGLKQDIVAKGLAFSQQAYSKLERGATNFTPLIIKKVCQFFNISASNFLNTGSQIKFSNSPQANTQNSFNNEAKIVDELIKSKEEIIQIQKQLILQLQATIIRLEKTNLKKS